MSVHSIFEGMALGLTSTEAACFNLVIAILVHKPVEAMTLGISVNKNFVEKNEKAKGILLLCVFSIATPLGVFLGMMLQKTSPMMEMMFKSFAVGTFLYIAASEVIVEEFSALNRYKWWQFFTFCCGIALICCLWFFES